MWDEFRALRRHVVDIELTNRCNASCDFCPRDAAPAQGTMTPAVFERVLARVVEFRAAVQGTVPVETSFCGLGEQLLNPHASEYVDRMRAAGIPPVITTNGALLTEERARMLLDRGLAKIFLNAGEIGEDYRRTYHVPFERTRDNILRFLELAQGRCEVWIVLVDHRRDAEHVSAVEAFWRAHGVTHFFDLPLGNRAGALQVDDMEYASHPHVPAARALLATRATSAFCAGPFAFPFVGWDGHYYLCSSDWKKEVPVGHVDDDAILDVVGRKLHHVLTHEPICTRCPYDPVNRLADAMRAGSDPGPVAHGLVDEGRAVLGILAAMEAAAVRT